MTSKIRIFLLKKILPELLRRRSPDWIPLSGKDREEINCFSIFLQNETNHHYFYADSLQGNKLHGKRWDGKSFSIDETIDLSAVDPNELQVTHYYGLAEIKFHGLWDLARGRLFGLIYVRVFFQFAWNKISQYIFNKRHLVTGERTRLLQFLINHHIDYPDKSVSVPQVMTGLYSARWVYHPDAQSLERKLELYLDSLCISGELEKNKSFYTVTSKAIATIADREEVERKHNENRYIQYGILFLTAAIVFFTAVQAKIIKLPTLLDWSGTKKAPLSPLQPCCDVFRR